MGKVTFRVVDPALKAVAITNYDLSIDQVVPYGSEVSFEIRFAQLMNFSSYDLSLHVTLGYGGSSGPPEPESARVRVEPGRTYEIGVTRRHAFDVGGVISPRVVF